MNNFIDIMIIISLSLFIGATLFNIILADKKDKEERLKDKKYRKIRVYNSLGKLTIESFEGEVIKGPHYLILKDKDNRIIFPGDNIVIVDEIKESEENV